MNTNTELTIKIMSFSYRDGVPQFPPPHNGGFVFDCRGIKNPGRLPEFKILTGHDLAVKEYLASIPETSTFILNVQSLIDLTVNTYIDRNFSELWVAFGCTGGQHRSVYFAEELFRYLSNRNDIKTDVLHLKFPKNSSSISEIG